MKIGAYDNIWTEEVKSLCGD